MRFRFAAAALAMLLLAGCDRKPESASPEAGDFALSLGLEAPGAQLMRLDLPAAALVAIQRADKGDIRVLDAQGRPLSMAFIAPDATQLARVHLSAIPFGGESAAASRSPVSIRVDQDRNSVHVEADGGKAEGPAHSVVFDSRAIKDSVVAIALDASLPKQHPIAVSVATGPDLKTWEPLAERLLFRPGDGTDLLGGNRLALPPGDLRDRYLKVSWQDKALDITGATLFTTSVPPRPRISVPVTGLKLSDPHTITLAFPPGLKPAAIELRMTGKDGVVPVRMLGRDTAEAPWTPLAMASLRQGRAGVTLESGGGPTRLVKIEADRRSAGFSRVPEIVLSYEPVALAVAFNGDGPYRLLVGNAAATPVVFPLASLTNGRERLGTAQVVGAKQNVTVALENGGSGSGPQLRVVALWAALLAGVALLGYAAFVLMRANNAR